MKGLLGLLFQHAPHSLVFPTVHLEDRDTAQPKFLSKSYFIGDSLAVAPPEHIERRLRRLRLRYLGSTYGCKKTRRSPGRSGSRDLGLRWKSGSRERVRHVREGQLPCYVT